MPKRITKKAAPKTLKGWQQMAALLVNLFRLSNDRRRKEWEGQIMPPWRPRTLAQS
jgi:hypothetical protein